MVIVIERNFKGTYSFTDGLRKNTYKSISLEKEMVHAPGVVLRRFIFQKDFDSLEDKYDECIARLKLLQKYCEIEEINRMIRILKHTCDDEDFVLDI